MIRRSARVVTGVAAGWGRQAVRVRVDVERATVTALGDLAGRAALTVVDTLLASGYTEQAVTKAIKSPAAERLVALIVESPLLAETIARVVDQTLERLPERAALWNLVDEVAQSPAVTEAIAHQGAGFADQVAAEVRAHGRNADDRLEQAARRVFWRRGKDADPAGPVVAPEPP